MTRLEKTQLETGGLVESRRWLGNKVPANFLKCARGTVTAVGPRCLESGRCNSGPNFIKHNPICALILPKRLVADATLWDEEMRGRTGSLGSSKTVG